MEITFDDHPARTIIHGESVPLVADLKMIRINGIHAGYCGVSPGAPVTMVRRYPESIMREVQLAVEARFGEVSSVNQPPDLSLMDEENEHDDDDDEGGDS